MKPPRSATPTPDAHGPLTVGVLTDATERQRFDALLEAGHFLGPASPPATASTRSPSRTASGSACSCGAVPAGRQARPPSISRTATPGSAGTRPPAPSAFEISNLKSQISKARRPNLASQILAAATAALPGQWLAHCGYAPLLAETFTDPAAHAGTCDQAAGWKAVGQTVGCKRHRCNFFVLHDHPQTALAQTAGPARARKTLRARTVRPPRLRRSQI